MIAFSRILCPTDFSATSTKALVYAKALALEGGPIHEAIVNRARARHIDLVVIGTHGRSWPVRPTAA